MNILLFGAGAIGSLFGALLSEKNNVMLIGRKPHVSAIKKNGLKIVGQTTKTVKIQAELPKKKRDFLADLLILTVKSYDTKKAIREAMPYISDNTIILSFQNGLDNLEKIKKVVDKNKVIAGVTTHGALFCQPGIIEHTGRGWTVIGELHGEKTGHIKEFVNAFNEVGIETKASDNIIQDMWSKCIINSSINPLTAFLGCKNGYLMQNPVLSSLVEKICSESTSVANAYGIQLSIGEMVDKTKKVIRDTKHNYSSMLQSIQRGRQTEIDSINGYIANHGKKMDVDVFLNNILVHLIQSLEH